MKLGAKYVTNSWGGPQFRGENQVSHFFNHPGTVISFASGDVGFGPTFPANLQYVTSIGGTTLRHTTGGRGWTESVWGSATGTQGTASGCSNQAKPSWQLFDPPGGCPLRTLGTPNGIQAFGDGPAPMVTVVDPGTQTGSRGHSFSVKIIGLDSRSAGSLRWSATGLPAGLSIRAVPHSTDAMISGTIGGAAGTYHVVVTAHDGSVTGSTHFNLAVH